MMQNPSDVGAVLKSSRNLADHMATTAGVREADLVVEYGPGTGAITQSIVEQAPDPSKIHCLEINVTFVELLRRQYPLIHVHNDSATDVCQCLSNLGHTSVDAIVSGLPFSMFDSALQNEIISETHNVLAPGGKFVTFIYCGSPYLPKGRSFQNNLSKHFKSVEKSQVIWKNFPPAYTLCATK